MSRQSRSHRWLHLVCRCGFNPIRYTLELEKVLLLGRIPTTLQMEEVVRGVASLLNPFTRGDSYPGLIGRLRRSRDRYDKLNASRIHRALQQRVVQLHFVLCCCCLLLLTVTVYEISKGARNRAREDRMIKTLTKNCSSFRCNSH